MKSRRSFIKTAGKGLAVSAIVPGLMANTLIAGGKAEKTIRIGIIGAENGHTVGFGKIFNIEKKFKGVEVVYVWGETDEFAKRAKEEGHIPNIVGKPEEMLGKIDALIVDHRHPKYHLPVAAPFVKAGIPVFIDKPFCYRVSEGREFLSMARKLGVPITSYSSIAQSYETFDIIKQVKSMGEISHVIACGPGDLDSPYAGVFFYGVHMVQPLMYIFGEEITKVRVTRNNKNATTSMVFKSGMLATLVFKHLSYEWKTFVETEAGTVELKPGIEKTEPAKHYTDMVEMFRTGKEPRSHDSILKCVAVLEALEKSALSDHWEEVIF